MTTLVVEFNSIEKGGIIPIPGNEKIEIDGVLKVINVPSSFFGEVVSEIWDILYKLDEKNYVLHLKGYPGFYLGTVSEKGFQIYNSIDANYYEK